MDEKPKPVAVNTGRENPLKRALSSIGKKNNNARKDVKQDVNPSKPPKRFLGKPAGFWVIIVVILLALVVGGYFYNRFDNTPQMKEETKPPTVTINDKNYTVSLLTTSDKLIKSDLNQENAKKNTQDQIKALESKIKTQPSYENFLALAQLSLANGSKTEAISYYKQAKDALSTKAEHYKETVDSIDATIKSLEAN